MLYSRGLIASWRLENTALDGSGNGNHGTLYGTPPSYVAGQFGQCLSFNGTTDYVDLPSDLSPRTMTLWANFNSVTTTAYFLGCKVYPIKGVRYDGTSFLVFTGGTGWSAVNWTKQNASVHFAAVIGSTTYDIYINAVKIGAGDLGTGGNVIHIRRFARRENQFPFPGPLDEINFWNRALSGTDIRRVMMGMHPIS